jgi:hypothetical protein
MKRHIYRVEFHSSDSNIYPSEVKDANSTFLGRLENEDSFIATHELCRLEYLEMARDGRLS